MAKAAASPKKKTIDDKVADLRAKRAAVELGGGKERIEKQHAAGKLTARERVERLVDKSSFQEIGLFARHRATYFGMADKDMPADGVVTGCATIDGRLTGQIWITVIATGLGGPKRVRSFATAGAQRDLFAPPSFLDS